MVIGETTQEHPMVCLEGLLETWIHGPGYFPAQRVKDMRSWISRVLKRQRKLRQIPKIRK